MKNRPFKERVGFALCGVKEALRSENSMRVHVSVSLLLLLVLLVTRPAAIWWAVLLLTAAVVLVSEMLNTALEILADVVSPQHDAAIGRCKDIAAGAVLFSCLAAVGVAAAFCAHVLSR